MKKEIVVKCPHCHEEISLMWDTAEKGFEIRCVYCGKLIMLCCECDKCNNGCDWDETYTFSLSLDTPNHVLTYPL